VRTICAWCEHEGKTVVTATPEPADELTVSYVICDSHTSRLVSRLHKYYPPRKLQRTA
jgi:hypothetical protein